MERWSRLGVFTVSILVNQQKGTQMIDLQSFLIQHPILSVYIVLMVLSDCYIHVFKFNEKSVSFGPTIFTTLGIFATFIGISLGLYNFNTDNVQDSLPSLLNGMKTAFWASAIGVLLALTIKIRQAIWGIPNKKKEESAHGATIDDLAELMSSIQIALVGQDDSTLLSQMKLARQDSNDRLDALRRSQESFMEKMADNNSKALIQALEEVMRDFNSKINEQFGENFKQLNLAVEKILIWQENYRQQMTEMIDQQKQTAINMGTATSQYSALLNKAEDFNEIFEKMSELIGVLNSQRVQIEQSLNSLGELLKATSNSLPDLEKKILELSEQMTRGVRSATEETTKTIRDTSSLLQNTISDTRKVFIETVQTVNKEFNTHISNITSKTQEQVKTLDIALEKELTRSLEGLGRQLTGLSQKFVEDYTPLTERLRQVLSIVKGV
ncbi:MAG: hypothetical protein ACYC9S_10090 [Leptospirales bacterium]